MLIDLKRPNLQHSRSSTHNNASVFQKVAKYTSNLVGSFISATSQSQEGKHPTSPRLSEPSSIYDYQTTQ